MWTRYTYEQKQKIVCYIIAKTKIYTQFTGWMLCISAGYKNCPIYYCEGNRWENEKIYEKITRHTHIGGPRRRRVSARKLYLYIKIHHITRNTIRSRRVKNMPTHTNRVYYMLYAEWVYTRYTFSMTPPIN